MEEINLKNVAKSAKRKSNKVNCIEVKSRNITCVVPESQPWENDSDYDNDGEYGGDKIMERSERDDRQWQLQNMHPTF